MKWTPALILCHGCSVQISYTAQELETNVADDDIEITDFNNRLKDNHMKWPPLKQFEGCPFQALMALVNINFK